MSDNAPMPSNYRRGRDKSIERDELMIGDLLDEFNGEGGPFFIGPDTQRALKNLRDMCDFYKQRCEEIHRECLKFRDPERQTVIEVIACGKARFGHAE